MNYQDAVPLFVLFLSIGLFYYVSPLNILKYFGFYGFLHQTSMNVRKWIIYLRY